MQFDPNQVMSNAVDEVFNFTLNVSSINLHDLKARIKLVDQVMDALNLYDSSQLNNNIDQCKLMIKQEIERLWQLSFQSQPFELSEVDLFVRLDSTILEKRDALAKLRKVSDLIGAFETSQLSTVDTSIHILEALGNYPSSGPLTKIIRNIVILSTGEDEDPDYHVRASNNHEFIEIAKQKGIVQSVNDIRKYTLSDIRTIRGSGEKGIFELRRFLKTFNIDLEE